MTGEKKNIALIGMPAAGKSSLGKLLSEALAWQFCDTDQLIEQLEGIALQEIVDSRGYAELRHIEAGVIGALSVSRTVIATGGSAVYSPQAMLRLQAIATIVYLHCDFSELLARLGDFSQRGLARPPNQDMKALYQERTSLYTEYSDFVVDTTSVDLMTAVGQLEKICSQI